MIKRHYTAHSLNEVANEPSVFKWVKGGYKGSKLDLTPVVENRNNVLLMGEHGGVLFIQHQPGLYEAHTQVLPAGRGRWALQMVKDTAYWMFTKTDAVELISKVPQGNLGALALVRAVHAVPQFVLDKGWILDDKWVPASVHSLTIQDWQRTAHGLVEKGEWFSSKLSSELDNTRQSLPDPLRDRYVGAAIEMAMAGQPHKGVVFWNRYALMVGYQPVSVVTERPLVMDIGGVLISIRDRDFWVIKCR